MQYMEIPTGFSTGSLDTKRLYGSANVHICIRPLIWPKTCRWTLGADTNSATLDFWVESELDISHVTSYRKVQLWFSRAWACPHRILAHPFPSSHIPYSDTVKQRESDVMSDGATFVPSSRSSQLIFVTPPSFLTPLRTGQTLRSHTAHRMPIMTTRVQVGWLCCGAQISEPSRAVESRCCRIEVRSRRRRGGKHVVPQHHWRVDARPYG